jgi:hypothetical protein
MPTLLDPKNDYVFKRLFADEPELLIALINAVRYRAPPIRSIRIRNPAIDPSELHGKYIMLDLLAEDSNGTRYNIEMQVRRQHAYGMRRPVAWPSDASAHGMMKHSSCWRHGKKVARKEATRKVKRKAAMTLCTRPRLT